MDVLIAGGGIGGLTTALSLHAAGIGATVLESARAIRPLGVGINLQPHAVRELFELGLADGLAAVGVPTAEIVYLDRHGNRVLTEPLGTARGYRWPQYSVHRGELQMTLLRAVRARLGEDAVRTGRRVGHVEQPCDDGVRVHVTDRGTGAGRTLDAPLLVGADGLNSRVRAVLHPQEGPLWWSGTMMWRGTAEAEPFLTGRSMLHGDDGDRLRLIAYPVSPAGRGTSLVNWVCQAAVSGRRRLPEGAGWRRPGQLDDVLRHFGDWDLGFLDLPGLLAKSTEILEYPMVDRDPLPWWGRGRVTLLGDAAHPMYPVGANGASQAIVDARVLAYELATATDPSAGLRAYERTRREATARVVLAAREMDSAERRVGRTVPASASRADGGARSRRYADITAAYRRSTGATVEELNARASLTPPRRRP
ncbi:FAD-dependent monooxygenase [Streptomyces gamaensis]|uniref:FAD-dependent monooxygenase n=1 Tax=Streptomyces gamaensis TaxID=1763542 RepID=A0ABW0Z501_9ACTN